MVVEPHLVIYIRLPNCAVGTRNELARSFVSNYPNIVEFRFDVRVRDKFGNYDAG